MESTHRTQQEPQNELIEVLKQILEQLQKISAQTAYLHSDLTRIATRQ